MPAHSYEFDAHQNRLIADLAKKMIGVGAFLIAAGMTALAVAAFRLVADPSGSLVVLLLAGGFFTLTGTFTLRSGRSFRHIVESEGNDVEHTMLALTQLDRFYTINFWLVVVSVVILITSIIGVPSAAS